MESDSGKSFVGSSEDEQLASNRNDRIAHLRQEFERRRTLYFVPAHLKGDEMSLSELIDEQFRFAASTSIRPLDRAERVLRERMQNAAHDAMLERFEAEAHRLNSPTIFEDGRVVKRAPSLGAAALKR